MSTSLSIFNPKCRCNILIVGFSGVGKSSFVNTMTTNEKGEFFEMSRIAPVREGNLNLQCTKEFKLYVLNNLLRVYDTWGFSGQNYTRDEFSHFLDGKYEVNSGRLDLRVELVEQENERIIDIVIFVVSAENGVSNEQLQALKPFYEIAENKNKDIFFIVTKMDIFLSDKDILIEETERALKICNQGREYRNELKKINDLFGNIPVFPMINYEYNSQFPSELIMELKKIVNSKIRSLDRKRSELNQNGHNETINILEEEKEEEIRFLRNALPRNGNDINPQRLELDVEDESKHIISHIYFRCIKMGRTIFRLSVVNSMTVPQKDIIGIFEPQSNLYYEVTENLSSNIRRTFNQSFSDDFVTEYSFQTDRGNNHEIFNPETTIFIILDLKVGGKKIYLTRRDFSKFHSFVESNIQFRKQIQNEDFKQNETETERKLDELKKLFQQENTNLREEIERKEEEQKRNVEEAKEELEEKIREKDILIRRLTEELEGKIDVKNNYNNRFNELEGRFGEVEQLSRINSSIVQSTAKKKFVEAFREAQVSLRIKYEMIENKPKNESKYPREILTCYVDERVSDLPYFYCLLLGWDHEIVNFELAKVIYAKYVERKKINPFEDMLELIKVDKNKINEDKLKEVRAIRDKFMIVEKYLCVAIKELSKVDYNLQRSLISFRLALAHDNDIINDRIKHYDQIVQYLAVCMRLLYETGISLLKDNRKDCWEYFQSFDLFVSLVHGSDHYRGHLHNLVTKFFDAVYYMEHSHSFDKNECKFLNKNLIPLFQNLAKPNSIKVLNEKSANNIIDENSLISISEYIILNDDSLAEHRRKMSEITNKRYYDYIRSFIFFGESKYQSFRFHNRKNFEDFDDYFHPNNKRN